MKTKEELKEMDMKCHNVMKQKHQDIYNLIGSLKEEEQNQLNFSLLAAWTYTEEDAGAFIVGDDDKVVANLMSCAVQGDTILTETLNRFHRQFMFSFLDQSLSEETE